MTSKVADIVHVDNYGRILLPHELQDMIGIRPHDKLVVGVNGDASILKKQRHTVFDLQRKDVEKGTFKKALMIEHSIDKAGNFPGVCIDNL